jgi:putative aminopeptidase FrvX
VGSQLVAPAEPRGHVVTGISKESGIDLLAGTGLDKALDGVETIVNVIRSPNLEQQSSTEFFTTVAENLGRAAAGAGVGHTVVLSIIAVDCVAAAEDHVQVVTARSGALSATGSSCPVPTQSSSARLR